MNAQSSRWPPSHLEPRWPARQHRASRVPTLRTESTDQSNTWDSTETEYTLEHSDEQQKRPCLGSPRSTLLLMLLACLLLGTTASMLMTHTYSFYCLFEHRIPITYCYKHTNVTLIPRPYLQTAIYFSLSAFDSAVLVVILLVLAKYHSDPSKTASHLDILPLKIIWRNVHLTRKFWTQLFLVACGASFNVYTAYFRLQPKETSSPLNVYVENVFAQRWFYTASLVEKLLLFVVMCMCNYARPSPTAPHLTRCVYYLVMTYLSVSNSLISLNFTYHLTFKVVPGYTKSIIHQQPAITHAMKVERVANMVHFIMMVVNTMLRASYWSFFASKLFEPSRDFFHTVHHPIPVAERVQEHQDSEPGLPVFRHPSTLPPPLAPIEE
eukprot:scpid51560/ scgid18283/ 